jgi:hypothetical protein
LLRFSGSYNYKFFSLTSSNSPGLNHMRMVRTMWSSMLIEALITYRKDQLAGGKQIFSMHAQVNFWQTNLGLFTIVVRSISWMLLDVRAFLSTRTYIYIYIKRQEYSNLNGKFSKQHLKIIISQSIYNASVSSSSYSR